MPSRKSTSSTNTLKRSKRASDSRDPKSSKKLKVESSANTPVGKPIKKKEHTGYSSEEDENLEDLSDHSELDQAKGLSDHALQTAAKTRGYKIVPNDDDDDDGEDLEEGEVSESDSESVDSSKQKGKTVRIDTSKTIYLSSEDLSSKKIQAFQEQQIKFAANGVVNNRNELIKTSAKNNIRLWTMSKVSNPYPDLDFASFMALPDEEFFTKLLHFANVKANSQGDTDLLPLIKDVLGIIWLYQY